MEFMSAREAADKWGISQRRVAVLCSESRIDNAIMVGNMWIIPTTAKKPIDARSIRYGQAAKVSSFQRLKNIIPLQMEKSQNTPNHLSVAVPSCSIF